jgi:imidazoleglycerol phosphate dehydratase HisB
MDGIKAKKIKEVSSKCVELEGEAEHSKIFVKINFGNKENKIETFSPFLDEMIKSIGSEMFGVEIRVEKKSEGSNVKEIAEVMGRGLREIFDKRKVSKISGNAISVVGNSLTTLTLNIDKKFPGNPLFLQVIGERTKFSDNLYDFFSGFSEGMEAEMQIVVRLGKNEKQNMDCVCNALKGSLKNLFGGD